MVCGLVSGVQQQLEGDQFPIPAMNAMIFPSNKANEAEADIMIVDIISPRMEGTEKLVWLSKHLMPAISLLATFACSPSNLTLSLFIPFTVPDVNMTANGRKCRGCFAINRQRCFAQAVAHCEGDQHYCSDVSGFAEVPSPIFAGNSSLPHSHLLSPRPHSSPEISFGTEHIYQGVCEALSYGAILVKYIGASGVHEAISVACAFPKSLPSSLPKFSKKPLPLPQIVCLSFTELNNQNLAMLSKNRSQTQWILGEEEARLAYMGMLGPQIESSHIQPESWKGFISDPCKAGLGNWIWLKVWIQKWSAPQ